MNTWNKKTIISRTLVLIIFGIGVAFILRSVFSGDLILPQTLSLGPVTLRYYGICIALAAGAAYWLALSRREDYGVSESDSDTLLLLLLIGGFVGARLYHVASEFSFYAANPELIPAVWRGGLSIFGALLGGVITAAAYASYSKQRVASTKEWLLNILDWLIPSFAIGQIIGRFGNLFNYEAYGYPTSVAWKMFVPPQFRLPPYEGVQFFHPLFLYEALLSGGILALLLWFSPKLRSGKLFFLWLILYNGVRFFLETLRVDSNMVSGIRMNRIVAGLLVCVGIVGYKLLYDNKESLSN